MGNDTGMPIPPPVQGVRMPPPPPGMQFPTQPQAGQSSMAMSAPQNYQGYYGQQFSQGQQHMRFSQTNSYGSQGQHFAPHSYVNPPHGQHQNQLYQTNNGNPYHTQTTPVVSTEIKATESFRAWVGKFPSDTAEEVIRALLESCGYLNTWRRGKDPESGETKSFGFAHFLSTDSICRALRVLNGFPLGEKMVCVIVDSKTKSRLQEERQKFLESTSSHDIQIVNVKEGEADISESLSERYADARATSSSTDWDELWKITNEELEGDSKALANMEKILSDWEDGTLRKYGNKPWWEDQLREGPPVPRSEEERQGSNDRVPVMDDKLRNQIEAFRTAGQAQDEEIRKRQEMQRKREVEALRRKARQQAERQKREEERQQAEADKKSNDEQEETTVSSSSSSTEAGTVSTSTDSTQITSITSTSTTTTENAPATETKEKQTEETSEQYSKDATEKRSRKSSSRRRSRSSSSDRRKHRKSRRRHRSRSSQRSRSRSRSKHRDRRRSHRSRRHRRSSSRSRSRSKDSKRRSRHKGSKEEGEERRDRETKKDWDGNSASVEITATTSAAVLTENKTSTSSDSASPVANSVEASISSTSATNHHVIFATAESSSTPDTASESKFLKRSDETKTVKLSFGTKKQKQKKDSSTHSKPVFEEDDESYQFRPTMLTSSSEDTEGTVSIPKDMQQLFAKDMQLTWAELEKHNAVERYIKPWVIAKVVEFLGQDEPTMRDLILNQLSAQASVGPHELLEELKLVLEDDAKPFMVELWQNLLYLAGTLRQGKPTLLHPAK